MKNKHYFPLILLGIFLFQACDERPNNRETFNPNGFDESDIGSSDENSNNQTPTSITRPSGAIVLQSATTCGCQAGKALTFNSGYCDNFCAGKNDETAILYVNAELSDQIVLQDKIKNIQGWCSNILDENSDNELNPSCTLQVKDQNNSSEPAPVASFTGDSSFQVNISNWNEGDSYRIYLEEGSSGATSTTIQLLMKTEVTPDMLLGPLEITPIIQYSCITRTVLADTTLGNNYYEGAYKLSFYYNPKTPPDPIGAGVGTLFCHDIQLYGEEDRFDYPRLDQINPAFMLWSKEDPRFYDISGNGQLKVNELIMEHAADQGVNVTNLSIFNKFTWPGSPVANNDAGNNNTDPTLGYFMSAWIDQTTFRAYCPDETHFYSDNPIFDWMKDHMGATEAFFIAQRMPLTIQNSDGDPVVAPNDWVLIPETVAKQIRFYLNDELVPVEPTTSDLQHKAIYFFWPKNTDSPFVQQSDQYVYRILAQDELPSSVDSINSVSSIPPHDNRLGCIPKIDEN